MFVSSVRKLFGLIVKSSQHVCVGARSCCNFCATLTIKTFDPNRATKRQSNLHALNENRLSPQIYFQSQRDYDQKREACIIDPNNNEYPTTFVLLSHEKIEQLFHEKKCPISTDI